MTDLELQNQRYLEAVERGEVVKAQAMVDAEATANGYQIEAYHGTPKGGFTVFEDTHYQHGAFFFTQSQGYAEAYTNKYFEPRTPANQNIYKVFLKITNPGTLIEGEDQKKGLSALRALGHDGAYILKRDKSEIHSKSFGLTSLIPGELEFARAMGGMLTTHVADGQCHKDGNCEEVQNWANFYREQGIDDIRVVVPTATRSGAEIAVFSPSQIKSADPITFDDESNVVPLSMRFAESNDIRGKLCEPAMEVALD